MKQLPKETLLLDAREKTEFDGVDAAKKSKGNIPGAGQTSEIPGAAKIPEKVNVVGKAPVAKSGDGC